jgi:hypothetical protein
MVICQAGGAEFGEEMVGEFGGYAAEAVGADTDEFGGRTVANSRRRDGSWRSVIAGWSVRELQAQITVTAATTPAPVTTGCSPPCSTQTATPPRS